MLLYCALHGLQRWKQRRHRSKMPLPVIIVGNLSVGGTGKTPLVIYLVNLLRSAGYQPAIITRGYGGSSHPSPILLNKDSLSAEVGDEPVLMARRTGVPVVVGSDRCLDVQYLFLHTDCDVVISDDGLQHYRLQADIEVAVVDGERQLGNGYCLPAGPLRETPKRLQQVDAVLLNNSVVDHAKKNQRLDHYPVKNLFSVLFIGDTLRALVNKKTRIKLKGLKGKTVHAVTGIGNPQRFYRSLEQVGLVLIKHSFPDHYIFKKEDLQFFDGRKIVMTEKDAVKCERFALDTMWCLPIDAQINPVFDQLIFDKLHSLQQQIKD